jgi:hypothetical protein
MTQGNESFVSLATAPRRLGSTVRSLAEDYTKAFVCAIIATGYRRNVYDQLCVPADITLAMLKDHLAKQSSLSLLKRKYHHDDWIIPHSRLSSYLTRKSNQSKVWRIRIAGLYSSAKRSITCLSNEDRDLVIDKHKASMLTFRPTCPKILSLLSSFVRSKVKEYKHLMTNNEPFDKPFSQNACLEAKRGDGPRSVFKYSASNDLLLEWRRCSLLLDGPGQEIERLRVFRREVPDVPVIPEVRAVPLPPHNCKIRVITIGSAHFHKLVPLQDYLIRFCRLRYPALRSPVHCNMIIDKLGPRRVGQKYISGDFEAATDNIHLDVTQTILLAILDVLPEFDYLRELALRDVSSHTITYPDGSRVLQVNGQLMGSLLSFPILCILNDFAYCMVYKNDRKLINGDDICFVSNLADYKVWCETCSMVGLIPSLGKNYFADNFVQMNNKTYYINKKGSCYQVPLVYTDLLRMSFSRSEIGQVFDEYFADLPLTRRRLNQFVSCHLSVLRSTPQSLILPISLGGLSSIGYLDFLKDPYPRVINLVYLLLESMQFQILSTACFGPLLRKYGFVSTLSVGCSGICKRIGAFAQRANHINSLIGPTEQPMSRSLSMASFLRYCRRLNLDLQDTRFDIRHKAALPHICVAQSRA